MVGVCKKKFKRIRIIKENNFCLEVSQALPNHKSCPALYSSVHLQFPKSVINGL